MTQTRKWMVRGTLLTVFLLAGVPAFAQTIAAGIDVWNTPDDGNTKITSLVGNPLPQDFFCIGSPAFSQEIKLKGKPIATSDNGLGSTDTIVQRNATSFAGGVASTQVQVKAISFEEHAPLAISCADGTHTFHVRVLLDQRTTAPSGPMTIHSDGTGTGGTFDATIQVPGRIVFTDIATGATRGPVYDSVNLQATGAAWADNVGTGGVNHPGSLSIDTDGNGVPDLTVPGTSNGFHTGWSNHCNPRCPVPIQHQGPHPVWPLPPPPPCSATVAQAASDAIASSASRSASRAATSTIDASVVALSANQVDSATPINPCRITLTDGTVGIVGSAAIQTYQATPVSEN
jgi:hypothetical protein